MGQMMQMNQILGDVKDLLRQQVLCKGFQVKYPKLATSGKSQGRIPISNKLLYIINFLKDTTQRRKKITIKPLVHCAHYVVSLSVGAQRTCIFRTRKSNVFKPRGIRVAILACY